jgi:hypothetical protein
VLPFDMAPVRSPRTPRPRPLLHVSLAMATLVAAVVLALTSMALATATMVVVVTALLGFVVGRTPPTHGPAWALLLRRLGRLVGTGVVAAGLIETALAAVAIAVDLAAPNVDPSNLTVARVWREATQVGAFGAGIGGALAVLVWVVALPGAIGSRWRGRVTAGPPPPRIGVTAAAVGVPLLAIVAAFETVLGDEDFLSGCSSGCGAFPLSPWSRAFGVAVAGLALFGAARLARGGGGGGQARRALSALGCTALALASLFASYTVYTGTFGAHYNWGFLGVPLARVPARGQIGEGTRVDVQPWALGAVLVVRQPDGEITRTPLSLGPFRLARPEPFVDLVGP